MVIISSPPDCPITKEVLDGKSDNLDRGNYPGVNHISRPGASSSLNWRKEEILHQVPSQGRQEKQIKQEFKI
jgi:hypothetical protein